MAQAATQTMPITGKTTTKPKPATPVTAAPRSDGARAARARYEQLVADAVARGQLRNDTDAPALARMIEVTLGGSFWLGHCIGKGPPPHGSARTSTPRSGRIWRVAPSDHDSSGRPWTRSSIHQ